MGATVVVGTLVVGGAVVAGGCVTGDVVATTGAVVVVVFGAFVRGVVGVEMPPRGACVPTT